MADLGIPIAANLIEVIGSAVIKDICAMWGYQSELADLNKTVLTIKNVLLDAEAQRELSNEAEGYIEELKAAVYDADDLFDEFLTLAELKQLDSSKLHGKPFGKVRCFFSSKTKGVSQAYRISHQVKDLKKQLDAIVGNHKNFGLSVDYKPITRRPREETCSYLDAEETIGREDDTKAVINMLLGPNDDEDSRFLTIVGVGGSGKTTLAQLVYNNKELEKEFPDPTLRLWVSVADQDGVQFDVKIILCKILELVTSQNSHDVSTMELVQKQFQLHLRAKKYLLVLDDVWNEDREEWLKLRQFLKLGQEGSRIVVTTRSNITAEIIGGRYTYKLEGLSPKNSWRLFEITAFDKKQEHGNHLKLVEIGKKIVEICYNIPLAIKVVGSLLYGQDISKWRSFEECGIPEIVKSNNKIMSILKLSYHNLGSSLKSCFRYCALFPKDFVIERKMLISLWIAQGYIVALHGGQNIEDAAEEHLSILLRRCFFEGIKKNEFGDIKSFKIHDLMHDVAQEVGRKEICVVSSITQNLGDKIRHVHSFGGTCVESSYIKSNIRSFLCRFRESPLVCTQIDRWMCLRVLDLQYSPNLPDSIGKLLHLRYLDLSYNESSALPNSITLLHNLQTLVLCDCRNLRELPKDFSKLVKLRHLDLEGCNELIGMPSGMNKLTSLRVLPIFVVGGGLRISSEKQCDGELQDLKTLTDIKDKINIKIGKHYKDVEDMKGKEGGYLESTKNLTEVGIKFDRDDDGCVDLEAVMEKLKPHSNLKGFILCHYKGTVIPKWGRAVYNWAFSLSHLVKIELIYCSNLKEIPALSELPFLKSLVLVRLFGLEYMENTRSSTHKDSEEVVSTTFFPSLDSLEMSSLTSLKGWWRPGEGLIIDADDDNLLRRRLRFSRLSQLKIKGCFKLTSFPPCLSLEDLRLQRNNDTLRIIVDVNTQDVVRLRKVKTDNVMGYLRSLHLPWLTTLEIKSEEVDNLSEAGEVFHSCASSLQTLVIKNCRNLRRLFGGGLEHLTALKSLTITGTDDLSIFEDKDDDDQDDVEHWKSLNQSLRSLAFRCQDNMMSLPKGLQYLTSLQSLQLVQCGNLEVLPKWIISLSSLQSLTIGFCNALKSLPEAMPDLQSLEILYCLNLQERCEEPNGEHWPKIQHIPDISIFCLW